MVVSLNILVLAAGASSRMAPRDKLLEHVDGQPLLARISRFALETTYPVAVVLPLDRPLRSAAIAGLPVRKIIAEKARDGMAESLKAGLSALPSDSAVMLLLADLPEIDVADLNAIITHWQAFPDLIVQATNNLGEPGHPVIFPAAFRQDLLSITGDRGAKAVLSAHANKVRHLALPGLHATTDLDTLEDWDHWRKSRKSSLS